MPEFRSLAVVVAVVCPAMGTPAEAEAQLFVVVSLGGVVELTGEEEEAADVSTRKRS